MVQILHFDLYPCYLNSGYIFYFVKDKIILMFNNVKLTKIGGLFIRKGQINHTMPVNMWLIELGHTK